MTSQQHITETIDGSITSTSSISSKLLHKKLNTRLIIHHKCNNPNIIYISLIILLDTFVIVSFFYFIYVNTSLLFWKDPTGNAPIVGFNWRVWVFSPCVCVVFFSPLEPTSHLSLNRSPVLRVGGGLPCMLLPCVCWWKWCDVDPTTPPEIAELPLGPGVAIDAFRPQRSGCSLEKLRPLHSRRDSASLERNAAAAARPRLRAAAFRGCGTIQCLTLDKQSLIRKILLWKNIRGMFFFHSSIHTDNIIFLLFGLC